MATSGYGQFCPISKAMEVLGEKWTLLVVRELWMGDISYKRAQSEGNLQLLGPPALTRTVGSWITPSIFAGIPPAKQIVAPA